MTTSREMPWNLIGLTLLGFACFLYWPGLHGPLLLDDYVTVKPLLRPDATDNWRQFIWSSTGPLGRPISIATFLLNSSLGNGQLWIWKLTNLTLHLATTMVLYATARTLFGLGASAHETAARSLALLVAALWLLHPLQPSTVLYTVQRMTQLAALFSAAGILCYLRSRVSAREPRWGLWVPYVVFLPLAAFSKETGLLLPLFLVALEVTVLRDIGSIDMRRHAWLVHGVLLGLPLLAGLAYLATHFDSAIWDTHLRRGFTLWERLMTEARVLLMYLAQILIPSRARLGFFHDDIPLSTSLLSPPSTLIAAFSLGGLLMLSWVLRRRASVVAFGMLWFFVGHCLESTIIPLELMFEHRNYLPAFGVLLAAIAAIHAISGRMSRVPLTIFAVIAVTLCAFLTGSIVNDWRGEGSLYAALYRAHPRSPSAASQLAEVLSARGRFDEARVALRHVRGAGPEIHRWFLDCRQHARLDDSKLSVQILANEAILTNYAVTGIFELARLRLDDHCEFSLPRFASFLAAAVLRPTILEENRRKLMLYEAHFAWKMGEVQAAYAHLRKVATSNPADPMPLLLMSEWKSDRGDTGGAREALAAAERRARNAGQDYSAIIEGVRAFVEERPSSH